jgi:putative FmdB family regulatory protein
MPLYEYRCRTCDTRFEARRPMSEATSPIACPEGHPDTTRLLSLFASVGSAASSSALSERATGPVGPVGGGCGPGCACAS